MPMSNHRLALAGILAAVFAVCAATGAGAAADPQAQAYDAIAQRALQDDGTYQGECWPWVRQVVFEATGREIGFDYRQGFFDAGAIEVSLTDARSGDIIQLADESNTSADADYPGLHTVIVLDNPGGGLVNAIDSNAQWDGIVRLRPGYDPAGAAARYSNISYHVYRITASAAVPAPAIAVALTAGDHAIVKADGDGLNLRTGPGVDKSIIGRLADGLEVTVTSAAPVKAGGRDWVSVSTPLGDGWVAAQYLLKQPSVPASTSGRSLPLMPYRTYMPLLSFGGE